MRLGFYGNYTEQVAEFATRVGFESIEVAVWPKSTVNPSISDADLTKVLKDLEKRDIEISALGYYPNFLDRNQQEADEARAYFLKVFDLAKRMGVNTVATHVGCNPLVSVEDNIPEYKEVFSRFCEEAAKRDVRIAIENCPMENHKTLHRGNIAYSPEIWKVMFEEVPADNLGLEIDPAHMLWLGIDYVQAVYDFGDKIFHSHAKDTEVRRHDREWYGIWGQQFGTAKGFGNGWWRARTPGWGDVDWHRYVTALIEVGYTGNLDIEHEDDIFASAAAMNVEITEESDIINNYSTEESGLVLGYNALRPIVPPAK